MLRYNVEIKISEVGIYAELTHRECVALALAHQEADLVPVDMLGNAS